MKPFLKALALFIPFFIAVYIILILIYGNFIPQRFQKNLVNVNTPRGDFLFTRLNDVKHYQNVDILFIGSSHAFRGFDTRIFAKNGYKCFNLGTSGQTPIQSETLLKRYFQVLKPKIVVIEVFPLEFQSDGIESDINFILNLPTLDLSKISINRYNNIKVINTSLCKLFSKLFNLTPQTLYANHITHDQYIRGGFVQTKRNFNKDIVNLYRSDRWVPTVIQKKAFENMIVFLKKNNTRFILVQSPVRKQFYDFIKNKNEVDNYFMSKGPYYDFNKIVSLRDTIDFFDSHHLSQSGVELFDRAFINKCLQGKN